jgi:hypothetical protein
MESDKNDRQYTTQQLEEILRIIAEVNIGTQQPDQHHVQQPVQHHVQPHPVYHQARPGDRRYRNNNNNEKTASPFPPTAAWILPLFTIIASSSGAYMTVKSNITENHYEIESFKDKYKNDSETLKETITTLKLDIDALQTEMKEMNNEIANIRRLATIQQRRSRGK